MKKITLLMTPLLLVFGLNAEALKAEKISSSNTMFQYSKPGASIDMKHESQKVDVNEPSDINITLSTVVTQGTLSAEITLDENLIALTTIDKKPSYTIQQGQQSFNINFQVKAEKQGLYYIRLLTKIDKGYGVKLRSFAVPVYVGKEPKIISKSLTSSFKALDNGERISVSKAVETIEIIKE